MPVRMLENLLPKYIRGASGPNAKVAHRLQVGELSTVFYIYLRDLNAYNCTISDFLPCSCMYSYRQSLKLCIFSTSHVY